MENMILMAIDECGYEVRVAGFHVNSEIMHDEDMLLTWQEVKMARYEREEMPEERSGLFWVNLEATHHEAMLAVRDFFY